MATIVSGLSSCAKSTGPSVLTPSEFASAIETTDNITLIDVRTSEEYNEGHIPDAVNVDVQDDDFLEDVQAIVTTAKPVALYCRSGRRSAAASAILAKAGYNVIDLDKGIEAWEGNRLPVKNGSADFYIAPNGKKVEIHPLIHASLRIVYDNKEIEIDPVGKMGDRSTDYAAFPKADLILVTHEHYDHLDPEAIKTLSTNDTIVIANPNSVGILGYGTEMKNGDKLKIADDIEIEAVPAYNVSPDRLQFHPKGRDNGYVLTLGGLRIYIAGDTEVIPEMEELKNIDIAFLPCNLPYTMTPEQLIQAAEIIKPKVLYPYHFGTTDLSTITPSLAPQDIYVRICPFDP